MAVRMIKIYWDPVADKYYRNKEDAAQEIVMGGTGGGVWGSITGTIGSQSDLMALLMAKDGGASSPVTHSYGGMG
jgi:hypothetical protein